MRKCIGHFVENLTNMLKKAANKVSFDVITDATYVCFHGWPRIETKAELDFYNRNGLGCCRADMCTRLKQHVLD